MLARGLALAGALATLVALGGCGGGDDGPKGPAAYPVSVEHNYVNACKKQGGDATTCQCTLRKVEEKFSYDDFKKEDAAIAAGRTPSRKLTDALAECRRG